MKSIAVSIPFIYEAVIRLHRQRMPVTIAIRDTVDVTIRGGDETDFPLAVRIHRSAGETELLRVDRHRLISPRVVCVDGGEARLLRMDEIIDKPLMDGSPFSNFWIFAQHFKGGKPCAPGRTSIHDGLPRERVIVQEWLGDNRKCVIKAAQVVADRLVFCDGVLHETVPEPAWHVRGGDPVTVSVISNDAPWPGGNTFPISGGVDAMRAAAERAGRDQAGRRVDVVVMDRVDIVRPDLIAGHAGWAARTAAV